ncbi:MAG: 30S ribosomal protein S9 [Parcubacteria group bacterium CG10_big_fil_rev_8_21_14_0_10_36_14]|nr:MAG: 30S ribosomal protein S9 [Parcubacteria group bacterium CG10_big_fil_rev_8_21_14_0_10_36_14]
MAEEKTTIKKEKKVSKKEAGEKELKKPKKSAPKKEAPKEPEEEKIEDAIQEEDAEKKEKLGRPGFLQAVGRRKSAIARVRVLKNGSGKATVNGKDIKEYFGSDFLVEIAFGALNNVSQLKKLDVSAKVEGGGKKGQAEAIRLGTARALLELNPVFRKNLRKVGYLTRDPRVKERKKPGLKKARRAPQWSKR